MVQTRLRAFAAISLMVLSAVALTGCESVRRYAEARQKMTATATELLSNSAYGDSYSLTHSITLLGEYSGALKDAVKYSGQILDQIDKAAPNERRQLGELFNLEDWAKLEVEMLRVAHVERDIADQCESTRFRDEMGCDTYRNELKSPLSQNRETLSFRYTQILKRI